MVKLAEKSSYVGYFRRIIFVNGDPSKSYGLDEKYECRLPFNMYSYRLKYQGCRQEAPEFL